MSPAAVAQWRPFLNSSKTFEDILRNIGELRNNLEEKITTLNKVLSKDDQLSIPNDGLSERFRRA